MENTDPIVAISGGTRSSILEAAAPVFLRFGLRKTSMEDVARAAGLSRQSLYLYFSTKDGLFRAVALNMLDKTRTQTNAALTRAGENISDRLLEAFVAMHSHVLGQARAEHLSSLFEDAASIIGPVFQELEKSLIIDIATLLSTSGAAAAWDSLDISAQDLAENLYSVSSGIRHRVETIEAYRDAMGIAIQIVCRGGPNIASR